LWLPWANYVVTDKTEKVILHYNTVGARYLMHSLCSDLTEVIVCAGKRKKSTLQTTSTSDIWHRPVPFLQITRLKFQTKRSEGKGIVVPFHAMKLYRSSGDPAPLILNLYTRWR
jgi:hypothetical protein